jgi:hypothetical protein
MARALTKTKLDGSLYVRPLEIERQIDEVLLLGMSELRQRLAMTDKKDGNYVHSESLVHLVRKAIFENRQEISSAVLPVLLTRCQSNLNSTIQEEDLPDVETVREEILAQFGELFALDSIAEQGGILDYYECRFNSAFSAFRISAIRKEITRLSSSSTCGLGIVVGSRNGILTGVQCGDLAAKESTSVLICLHIFPI